MSGSTEFMKPILLLLLTSALAFAGVEITDDARVLLDGKDIGAVPDAMFNKVVSPDVVQTSLVAKLADSAAKAKKLTDFLAKAQEAFNAGDFDAAKAILNPEIDKAKLTEKQRQIDELTKQAAEIQAKIDALNVSAAAVLKAKKLAPVPAKK